MERNGCFICSVPPNLNHGSPLFSLNSLLTESWPGLRARASVTYVSGLLLREQQLTTTALAPFHCEGVTEVAFKSRAEKTPEACSFFLTGAGAHERSDSSSKSHPGLAGSRHTKACLSPRIKGSGDTGQGLKMDSRWPAPGDRLLHGHWPK